MRAKILVLAICALAFTSLLLSSRAMQNGDSITLDLIGQGIDDAKDVNIPRGTTTVFLDNNNITNLNELVIPNSVRTLFINNNGLTDESLSGLVLPPNLRELALINNSITNLAGLGMPSNLVDLDVSLNQIDSFDKLGNLPESLEILTVEQNQISGGVFNAPNSLRLISLSDNPIGQLTNLTLNNVDKLEAIDLLRIGVTDISDIGTFFIPSSLRRLNLGSNEIADISPIVNATNLTGLIIGSDSLTSLDGVQLPPNLEFLALGGVWTDMTGLIYNDKLRVLEIGDNNVDDVSKFKFSPNLKAISIASSNNVSDLSNLSLHEGLEIFDFSLMDLGDVSKFPTLPESIRKVSLSFNEINSISGYTFPKNTRVIIADFNFLTDFDPKVIPKGSKLRRLSLFENRIDNRSRRARLRRRIRRRASRTKVNFNGRFSQEVRGEFDIDFEFPD